MVIESSLYSLWNAFFFLELLGVKYITNPKLRSIRLFLAFCALRDVLLFIFPNNSQAYWDIGWTTKQMELIWLAWIAGYLSSVAIGKYQWPAKIPAFVVSFWSLLHLPYYATPLDMQRYQAHCHIIIIGTLLIGCFLTIPRHFRKVALAVAVLSASGLISAVTFQAGNWFPRMATAVWILGLLALLADPKDKPQPLYISELQSPDEYSRQQIEQTSRDMLEAEASRLSEWISMPCHNRVQ